MPSPVLVNKRDVGAGVCDNKRQCQVAGVLGTPAESDQVLRHTCSLASPPPRISFSPAGMQWISPRAMGSETPEPETRHCAW